MAKLLKVFNCYVCEGMLYQVMGEDEMLTVYDLWLEARDSDGALWKHHHVFKGAVECDVPEDCGGGSHMYPNYDAKRQAEELCDKVKRAGKFNPDHWVYYGHEDEADGYANVA